MAFPSFLGIGDRNQATGNGMSLPATPTSQADDYDLWVVETAAEAISLLTAEGAALVTGSEQDGGTSTRITCFDRVWNGTDGTPTVVDSGDHQHARGVGIRGIDTGDPINVLAVGQEASGTSVSAVSGISTTRDECLIVFMCVADLPDASGVGSSEFSAFANSNLTSVTERGESTTDQGNGGALFIGTGELATAGPIGTFTLTSATTSVKAWAVIAVQPPAAGAAATVGQLAGGAGLAGGSGLAGGGGGLVGRAMTKLGNLWVPDRRPLVPVGIQLQGA